MPKRQVAKKVPQLFGYCRVSTDDQYRNGISLDVQRDRLEAYAQAHGFTLAGVEEDPGISGSVPLSRRPGFGRVLAALDSGEASGVLILKLDRLSRNTRHVLDLVDRSRREKWRLVSVSESLDTGTAAGRLVVTVLAALAEMERDQVSERTRLALDKIARDGRARSRLLPFGYRTTANPDETTVTAGDRSMLIPHKEEQKVLKRMLALRNGGQGPRKIARSLNDAGIRNPRTGKDWSFNHIQVLLRTVDRREEAMSVGAAS